jgi:hypothetical protein
MAKRMTKTQAWLQAHPNDTPPPKSDRTNNDALAWRRKRFQSPRHAAELAKYEQMLAEMRADE